MHISAPARGWQHGKVADGQQVESGVDCERSAESAASSAFLEMAEPGDPPPRLPPPPAPAPPPP
eukprot:SAG22_NODE_2944_length_2086_cov_0.956740_1_plen_63_part_10